MPSIFSSVFTGLRVEKLARSLTDPAQQADSGFAVAGSTGRWRPAVRWTGLLLLSLVLALLACVGALALWYRLPFSPAGKTALALAWQASGFAVAWLLWRQQGRKALMAYIVATAGLMMWWSTIEPSNHRVWADDVTHQLVGRVSGDVVTLQNVRNFDWRSDTDYTARWETRQYRLSAIRSVDVGSSYWMGPAIAHTLVSFGFDDGRGGRDYLAFSVEIRKERGEGFSAVAGFFKQFELAGKPAGSPIVHAPMALGPGFRR